MSSDLADKSASAPSSPTKSSKLVHGGSLDLLTKGKGRRVTFPADDLIVSGYLDPPDPWVKVSETDSLIAAYHTACAKHAVKPVSRIVHQLRDIRSFETRETDLNLKGERLDSWQCETLEEIFKRIQFNKVDFEACQLDDDGSAALFDMIDYYESASELNISFNRNIDYRGWQACARMLKKTTCLHYLDAKGTKQNEQTLLILGRALRTGNNLVALHMENCGLTGRPLVILVAAIKLNNTLRELYLGENKIIAADGIQLGNLLQANSTLELLDLRSNNLQDLGICHLADGLCQQIINNGEGLKTLILWNNHMTQIGMQHVNRILLSTRSLATLNLGQNNISNEGIHQLKQGLIHSQTLKHLGIQCCKITCEGAVALAEYIADNQHINHIDLRENNVQIAGLMALALSLKHNHSVTRLDMDPCAEKLSKAPDGVQDNQKLLKEIASYCKRNKTEQEELSENNRYNKYDFYETEDTVIIPKTKDSSLTEIIECDQIKSVSEPIQIKNLSPMQENQPSPVGSPSPGSRFRVSRVYLDERDNKRESSPIAGSPGSPIQETLQQIEKLSITSTATIKSKYPLRNGIISLDSSFQMLKSDIINEENKHKKSQSLPQETEQTNKLNNHKFSIAEVPYNGETLKNSSNDINQNLETNLSKNTHNAINKGKKYDIKRLENYQRSYSDVNHRFQTKKAINFDYLGTSPSSSQGSEDESEKENKKKKKITFLLPEAMESSGICMDRRMSTPALPMSRKKIERPSALNLKLGRQLESLDLRSSVPLSPTRLLEGFEFPLPTVEIKISSESANGITNRQL